MFTMDSIHPVSDFSRKPAEYIKRLKKTKQPEILTVNGKAEVVVQDAQAYEEMMDLLNTIKTVSASAESFDREEGKPVEQAFLELDRKIEAKYAK
ncbi:hypothetical protein MNBD_GAMMA09-3557 [hydrothermal vent metagenome]|uniref:Antitoxin n=1 Tax=hydrothermal vent metagenome TaxID=652676 RepID=A0A3B0YHA8_9ZZZZ